MDKSKIFRVHYQTGYSKGCIRVYVAKFFGEQTKTTINKLLKLAKTYCTCDQQTALLHDLEAIKQEISTGRYHNSYKEKLIAKLDWCISKVKAKAWGQDKKS